MSLSTNLILSGIGLTTVGGIVTGSYILLKDNPRKITEFLKVKNRIMLSRAGDTDAWNKNWEKYVKDNAPKAETATRPNGDGATTQAAPQTPVNESKNFWDLTDFEKNKKKPNEAQWSPRKL